uniref:Uncharacterized protein n=1 Tax=Mycena chlorophos TaxID=658473 RepID=A0ABQ0LV21_MYCCL|nr:predicted protein [Mycena chlorophos]
MPKIQGILSYSGDTNIHRDAALWCDWLERAQRSAGRMVLRVVKLTLDELPLVIPLPYRTNNCGPALEEAAAQILAEIENTVRPDSEEEKELFCAQWDGLEMPAGLVVVH